MHFQNRKKKQNRVEYKNITQNVPNCKKVTAKKI